MDLVVVSDVFLCEAAFNFLKVPVWNLRHILQFFRLSSHVLVGAIGPTYAESETIVVALSAERLMRLLIFTVATLVVSVVAILPLVAPSVRIVVRVLLGIRHVGGHRRTIKALMILLLAQR